MSQREVDCRDWRAYRRILDTTDWATRADAEMVRLVAARIKQINERLANDEKLTESLEVDQ